MAVVTRLAHTRNLLNEINRPINPANELVWLALAANEYGEFEPGPDHPQAEWNLWDTTEPGFGGTPFNDVPVMNYPTEADGLAATAATLNNGRYDAAMALMANENPGQAVPHAVAVLNALAGGGWGSINTSLAQQVADAWSVYGNIPVSGSSEETPPEPEVTDVKDLIAKNSNGAVFVVAHDLSHKVGVVDPADAQALLNTGDYSETTLTDEMLNLIPTVVQ